jgi:hypothetical protein
VVEHTPCCLSTFKCGLCQLVDLVEDLIGRSADSTQSGEILTALRAVRLISEVVSLFDLFQILIVEITNRS